jgi:hypothetical protein
MILCPRGPRPGRDDPGERGKHIALDHDYEQEVLDWIQQNAEEDSPVTRGEIMDYCVIHCKIKLTRGWVNSYILRHSGDVVKMKNTSQEWHRWQVARASLERIIQDLHQYVQRYAGELMLNLNEVGISDSEGRKTKKVIIPAAMLGQTIHHGVSRNVKHISAITCVCAAEESLLPHIIGSFDSSTGQEHLKKQSIRFGGISL